MKITLLGSLGHINRLVIPELVQAGAEVTVITTNAQRAAAIQAMGAQAAIGDMQDEQFLAATFAGQDVVYLMLAGHPGNDPYTSAVAQANIWVRALRTTQVKNVVDLSSIGADAGEIAGSLHAYHLIEHELRQLPDVNLAFVRPTGFYANLLANLPTIKQNQVIYSNQPATLPQKYVAPSDIAAIIVPLLLQTPTGITVKYAFSDTFTGEQFITKLQAALKMPHLKWIQISDAQYLQNLTNHGVPQEIATSLVQTSRYQRQPEQLYADLTARETVAGKVKLADFIQEYVAAIHGHGEQQAHTIAD
ncbi:SDR family oxidoreductase [Lapidilactobacillus wuchangensis]|uniref:SDR family oxidoreductase n=1 Tax=Lapidilactobacillus wuchangensis TaxID=2486001 RepID=UPI000F783076|nr:NAD(P)H-binding protein [Lapidilactobacillus wuchangensis]